MDHRKWFGRLLCTLALILGLGTAVLALAMKDRPPVLISQPRDAAQTVKYLMEAVSRGNFPAASLCMENTPDLGPDREPEDPVGKLLWNAWKESFSYTLGEQCYAGTGGVSMDVELQYLDLDSVCQGLGKRVQTLLRRRVSQAEDMQEVYDENNEYREEIVAQVLTQAVEDAIAQDGTMTRETLTVTMTRSGGRWWVIPDSGLLEVLSGGTMEQGGGK